MNKETKEKIGHWFMIVIGVTSILWLGYLWIDGRARLLPEGYIEECLEYETNIHTCKVDAKDALDSICNIKREDGRTGCNYFMGEQYNRFVRETNYNSLNASESPERDSYYYTFSTNNESLINIINRDWGLCSIVEPICVKWGLVRHG